jgi:hypothetical protein
MIKGFRCGRIEDLALRNVWKTMKHSRQATSPEPMKEMCRAELVLQ